MRVLVGRLIFIIGLRHSCLSGPISQLSISISRWIVGRGSHAGVYPANHKFREKIVKALSKVEGVRVFQRGDIPGDLHYRESRNSPPILVLAEPQTIILSNPIAIQRPSQGNCWDSRRGHQARRRFPPDMDSSRLMDQTRMGLAGYSPYEGDMRGIFLAQGPGRLVFPPQLSQ